MALAAMMICLGASAIDKVVKKSEMKEEVTSVADLANATFMLQSGTGEEAVVLYTPSGWDIKVAPMVTAIAKQDNGGFFKLEALGDHYLIPVFNINKERRTYWAGNQYVNAQPTGNVIFGLAGTNDQHGQDGENLAVWDIAYTEGQGFTFHCYGRDVYIGYDAVAARPSTTPVYWRAYKSYIAGYDVDEVTAAYEAVAAAVKTTAAATALSEAKTAYDSDNDLDKFGDAVNAAIDVVNACVAINATYTNLDTYGAAIATEVLAKYNAGEYANAEELRAAYIVAAKAQRTAGADFTGAIINPGFEYGNTDGWTTVASSDTGARETSNGTYAATGSEGNYLFNTWWKGTPCTQTIAGLPNGTYKLSALVASDGATIYLTANGGHNEGTETGGEHPSSGVFQTAEYEFAVTDGTATIGVVGGADGTAGEHKDYVAEGYWWYKADNFKLTLVELAPEAPTTYAITIAEGIENGSIEADVAEAAEGTKVTLTIEPADGYELDELSVKNGEDDVEVAEDSTFIMPAGAVLVSATFKEVAAPEPETPSVTATLVHTAGTGWGSNTGKNTVDGEAEYYNNEAAASWSGAAFAEFSFELPKGATITKATLTWSATNGNNNGNRDNKIYYLNEGQTVDYEALTTSEPVLLYTDAKTYITNVPYTKGDPSAISDETDVTDAVKALAAQKSIIFQWIGNSGGATLAGKASENAPKLVIEYIPGAPELANPSFDVEGDFISSDLGTTGSANSKAVTEWTNSGSAEWSSSAVFGYGTGVKLNGVAIPATDKNANTTGGALGITVGWGGVVTYTQEVTLPAGDYILTVDAYNGNADVTQGTSKFGFVSEGTSFLSTRTSFPSNEWITEEIAFTLAEETTGKIQVGLGAISGGSGSNAKVFFDNVTLTKVPGVELALIDLKQSIEAATTEKAKYAVGDGLFQYAASEIEPLTDAIATAQAAYNAAESKDAVNSAKETLDAFVATFAPVMTAPAANTAYTVANATAEGNLSITTESVKVAKGATVFFTAVEGGFILSNEAGEYIFKTTGNTWTLSTTTDAAQAYVVTINPVEGGYTIQGAQGLFGLDNTAEGSTVYANKAQANNGLWTIAEYVAPSTYAITIADGIEGGKVEADVEKAEAGATVTLTITPNEGYELTALSVKAGEDDVEVAEGYTFVMPAAAVTVFATFKNPNDYTNMIVNADLTGEGGFDATGTKGIDGSGVVKVGNAAAFDFKQTIANLPAGQYKLTAQAAYRYGGSEADEYNAIVAETETKLVQLYATVGETTVATPIQNRYDGASETDYANGEGSVVVNEKYVPNSTNAVKAWFAAGQYVNEVIFNIAEAGDVTIGINRTGTPESDYTVIGPWTLTRLGDAVVPNPTYEIAIKGGIENGTVEADATEAEAGATVKLTITPAEGYELKSISISYGEDEDAKTIEPDEENSFIMPAAPVVIDAVFSEIIPDIVLSAPTFNMENGTQNEPSLYPAGTALKVTYTAENLEANGLTADDVQVKILVMLSGDLPEETMNMQSETKHSIMPPQTFYIPLGETDFPEALKNGYVYQSINILSAELVKPATETEPEEILAAYVGAPVQLHWVGLEAPATATYAITVADEIEGGEVEADVEEAAEGAKVTLTITPDEDYKLGTVTVSYVEGDSETKYVEVAADNTFIMPAAPVNVSATFIYVDPNLIEIAQSQSPQISDGATRATVVEGDGYTQYTTDGGVCVIVKMYDVDVTDCDYVVIKFAEPIPSGICAAFWAQGSLDNIGLDAGISEYKYVFANDTKCAIQNGILPQITLLTLWNAQTVKISGIYKHLAEEPDAIDAIETAEDVKADGKYMENGKLVIIKNGHKYNASGLRIK